MEELRQNQALMLFFASLKKDMDDIKRRLDGKTPFLLTEEAVEGFTEYLDENTKPNTARSFTYLLSEFGKAFPGANIAEIPPLTLQAFLAKRWGERKKTVLKQYLALLKWFFGWSIKYCQKKGLPPFLNPCDLIEIKGDTHPKRPDFIPEERMREFLASAKKESHWLMFAILMTAGLRVSELIGDRRIGKPGLRKMDVNGRVLTIWAPKSGREKEIAVIPQWVSERLNIYMADLPSDKTIFDIGYSTAYDIVKTHANQVGLSFSPHHLRKWIASFWHRLGEYEMANFTLRHSSAKVENVVLVSNLGARYIAQLSIEDVMAKQDKFLKEVCGEISDR